MFCVVLCTEAVHSPGPELLSAGPCSEKNVGPFNWGGRPYLSLLSLLKNWRLFCSCTLLFIRGSPIFFGMQKITSPFVGPLFCGGACSAEHADMPKSAAGTVISTLRRAVLTVLWIGFCHTGLISLCRFIGVYLCVFCVFILHYVLYYCEHGGV